MKPKKTFKQYIKESAYWFGFKSPRWTLFIPGIFFFFDTSLDGLVKAIAYQLFALFLLWEAYEKHNP